MKPPFAPSWSLLAIAVTSILSFWSRTTEIASPPSPSSPPVVIFLGVSLSPCPDWKSPSLPRNPGVTKHEFVIPTPGGNPGDKSKITSLVMDEAEFEAFLQHVVEGDPVINVMTKQRMRPEDVESLRKAKHVPLIARGMKTEHLFKLYEVDSDLMSVIVRGQGEKLIGRIVGN
jgi:hypothetical protein